MESSLKKWPESPCMESIALNGYHFDKYSICTFDTTSSLNLSNVLIELDPYQECNCFVFYIYKNYRLNSNNNIKDWLLGNRTPICYRDLYNSINGFEEIEKSENYCDLTIRCNDVTTVITNSTLTTNPSSSKRTTYGVTPSIDFNSSKSINQASVIVIAVLAALSFILLISLICMITFFLRKPSSLSVKPNNDEYYRV